MKSKAVTEKVMQGVFFIAACTSVLAVALICIFLFANGIPAIREIGFVKFITGDIWRPGNKLFGIFPMIIGSIYVTAGAIIFGVPIGILTSVFMAMYCPKKIYKPLKAATELLAGIPSVVSILKIEPFLHKKAKALSGGMQKRLSIACALASRPTLLLLDEPDAALDLVCKEDIREYIRL